MSKPKKSRHASVWDAIEDTPGEAAHMKARSALMAAVIAQIEKNDSTQGRAAKQFGVTQPRISDLMRGKIDLFSLDTLVNMLAAAGIRAGDKAEESDMSRGGRSKARVGEERN